MFWSALGVALGPIGWVAVGAITAGVAVAAAMSDSEEQAEKRGEQRATTKLTVEIKRVKARARNIKSYMVAQQKNLSDWQKFGEKLIAMVAVGFACANCDGEIHPKEIDEIDEFIAGVNHSDLPPYIKERINKLRREPPNLKTAFELAKKAKVKPSILDDTIDVVMHADGIVHDKEKAFMNAWHKMKRGTLYLPSLK